jgi:glycosyltransferase involved in cell wall biosynthesis
MSVLFGHPTGNPNSYHSAQAHFDAGRLKAFCVPWLPSPLLVKLLVYADPSNGIAKRFARRQFAALSNAPLIQDRLGEWRRLLIRAVGYGSEALSYEANDWLMNTMARECKDPTVSTVHSYEDCALWQFLEAKKLGKACVYDMPIGYYPAWEKIQSDLAQQHVDWLPEVGLLPNNYARPQQKLQEMELADVVMVACRFVEKTIRAFYPNKIIRMAPYGVDLDFWNSGHRERDDSSLRFIYAGQISLRKGIPVLLDAWEKADLREAELELIGSWQLAEAKKRTMPANVKWYPPCGPEQLRERFQLAHAFVFPSFFEGFGLVLLEAMACGLPVIASEATAAPDVVSEKCGLVLPTGNVEALVESLRWFSTHRARIGAMSRAARMRAQDYSWAHYRRCVSDAVASYV